MANFNAKAILMERVGEKNWTQKDVTIDSIESLRKLFHPYESKVEQVNISLYSKVYYCVDFITSGVEAHVTDSDGDRHFMASPILLVECDESKPIDMSEEMLKNALDAIDFF